MEAHGHWLGTPLVLLAAAVLAVPLARGLKLGAILGYLVAGVLIGPSVLGLIARPETVLEIGEFGVVLMMFLVGLELEPRRLWALRRPIFGLGSAQMLGCSLLLLVPALWLASDWHGGLVAALGLAMSSTAVALSVLAERNLAGTSAGQSVVSVALLQDMAAIPVLALIPLLAAGGARQGGGSGQVWAALAALVAIVLVGRLAMRPLLRWIAKQGTPEVFTAASLLLVLATAALMQQVGLSMALGAFAAGVLLAESEYRRALEADLEPFKGLLLGMFFIAVGMGLDLAVLWQRPLAVLALLAALWVCKGVVLMLLARLARLPLLERPVFVILLAQGGEFGFVVFQLAEQARLIDAAQRSVLVAAVALSLALTPLLLAWAQRRAARRHPASSPHALKEAQATPVIIAGFGRYGQIVGRLLNANGLAATVLDHDADTVETLRRFGWRVFWGDATRLDLLRIAGAEQARVLVIAVDDVNHSLKIAELARQHFPQLRIVARARNVQHVYALRDLGVELIERETLDAALTSGRSVMELLGWSAHAARQLAWRFRRHNLAQVEQMRAHRHDQDALIALTQQGRRQLEELLARERADQAQRREQPAWHGPAQPPASEGGAAPRQ